MAKINKNNSNIIFKLADVMKQHGISKNKLGVEAHLRFETVQGYYMGTISRVDLYVLSEICRVLDCQIEDILEYVPKKES